MRRTNDIYLDIETDWDGAITVVGFFSEPTGMVQLVGDDLTDVTLDRALPAKGALYTYNGHSFDIPMIRKRLGLNLRERFESCDLRWLCQRHDLTGGQKSIEKAIGLKRGCDGMDGRDALELWHRFTTYADEDALDLLLAYNEEDVRGLVAIRAYCEEKGFL